MTYFANADEVYRYVGGAFRLADKHAVAGPKLRAAGVTMRLEYTDPAATLTIRLAEPALEVIEGDTDVAPDVTISMSADKANKFWRGEYNAALGMAKGEAKTKGPVGKILKLLPAAKPVFPLYKELTATKDAAP